MNLSRHRLRTSYMGKMLGIAIGLNCLLSIPVKVMAEVVRDDQPEFAANLGVPVYAWSDTAKTPRAVVVLVHGLLMHGGAYDSLARELVTRELLVVAFDMRGYGRWNRPTGGVEQSQLAKYSNNVDYRKSQEDLLKLLAVLEKKYPNKPRYCIGESLGADMIIRAVSSRPELISGVILSNPALSMSRIVLARGMISFLNPLRLLMHPSGNFDLTSMIDHCYASEDPRVCRAVLADPLVRKKLSFMQLLAVLKVANRTLRYARNIPATMPVLILQGNDDHLLRPAAVSSLKHSIHSQEIELRWFEHLGHILLETKFLKPPVVETIGRWFDSRAQVP